MLAGEKATTAVAFLHRGGRRLPPHGIQVELVSTDNGDLPLPDGALARLPRTWDPPPTHASLSTATNGKADSSSNPRAGWAYGTTYRAAPQTSRRAIRLARLYGSRTR